MVRNRKGDQLLPDFQPPFAFRQLTATAAMEAMFYQCCAATLRLGSLALWVLLITSIQEDETLDVQRTTGRFFVGSTFKDVCSLIFSRKDII